MDKTEEQRVMEKYKLTDAERLATATKLFEMLTYGKQTSNRPFATIVLGQPGAGKSGLMSFTSNQFPTSVALDIDDLREHFPKEKKAMLEREDAGSYERVTGAFATDMVITFLTPWLIESKYDLILHKTRADDRIITDTVEPLQADGYEIVLRVLAVHELESKMSALERSLAQRKKIGYCRWVETKYHNDQYQGILDIASRLEDQIDAMEVYVRGEIPVEPRLVYSKVYNPSLFSNPHMMTADGMPVIVDYQTDKFPTVNSAIQSARDKEVDNILETIPGRIKNAGTMTQPNDRAHEFIGEIQNLQKIYTNKYDAE